VPDSNIIKLDLADPDATYHVRRRTTGADYLRLQTALGTDEQIDTKLYTFTVMRVRCRELDKMTDDEIVALPRAHYQTLSRLCTELEAEENQQAEGFLPNGYSDSAALEQSTPLAGSSKRSRGSSER
jgi:hypothetical protein